VATRPSVTVAAPPRLTAWLAHHRRVAWESLAGLLRNGVSSALTWLVIGIALVLPALGYVLLKNATTLTGGWDGKPRLTVYFDLASGDTAAQRFASRVKGWEGVDGAEYISRASALAEFQRRSGFGDVITSLARNPLPAVVTVTPSEVAPGEIRMLAIRIEGSDDVDDVVVDLAWVERLSALLTLAQRAVWALGSFLGLGVLLIIGNTIRLSIESRRSEIEVIKLVGATDGFVRRPFLYLGLWYGLGGAVLAIILLTACLAVLSGPVQRLLGSYGSQFDVHGLGLSGGLLLMLIGSIFGIGGAWLAVSRHLDDIQPQ